MTIINSFSPARQQNTVAFKGDDKNHPVAALFSAILPGSGQLLKGEDKNGFTRLGLEAGILASIVIAGKVIKKSLANNLVKAAEALETKSFIKAFKALHKGISKTKIAGGIALAFVPIVALAVNHVNAAKDAYKPTNKESDTT